MLFIKYMNIYVFQDNMAKTLATFFTQVMREPHVYDKLVKEIRSADTSSLQSMDKSLLYTETVSDEK